MFTIMSQDKHGVYIRNENQGAVCYGRIRKLTPRECFRLQAFSDEQFDKAKAVCSDSQLYKMAGNAVSVNVVYLIGRAILKGDDDFWK